MNSILRLSALVLLGVCATAVPSVATEFAIVAVRSDGDHTIDGPDIRLAGAGQRVFLDIFISNWDPDLDGVPLLKSWQVEIDPDGYSSGMGGSITPAFEACIDDLDCKAAFGGGSFCDPPVDTLPGVNCAPGFIDFFRSDYVFAGIPDLFAVDISSLGYRYASTSFGSFPVDPGEKRYAGSLVVDVPIDALGTYSIAFRAGFVSLVDQNDNILLERLPLLTSARIIITCTSPVECNDGNPCTFDNCVDGACFRGDLNGIGCNDLDRCTTGDICEGGACAGIPLDCADGEQCDPADGMCKQCVIDADCDDEDACTDDFCSIDFDCLNEPNFNDAVFCCDPPSGVPCEAPVGQPGDGDGNGTVDLADFALFMLCYEAGPAIPGCGGVDTTCDCRVDGQDLPGFISSMTDPIEP